MMQGWKKIKSKIVHQNPWYEYREDDVIQPGGRVGKYFVVVTRSCAGVIVEDSDGNIFLAGQNRYPSGNNYSWEMICGALEKRDTPLKAAKRELEEEAGIIAHKWKSLGCFDTNNGFTNDKCYLFLAQDLKMVKQKLDSSENITIKKETIDNILKMIRKNQIVDGLTISAVMKYLLYKKKINL